MQTFWIVAAFLVTSFFAIAHGTERWLRWNDRERATGKRKCPVCLGKIDAASMIPNVQLLCLDHLNQAMRIRVAEYDLFERWDDSVPKKTPPPPAPPFAH